jgi:hypothetical protein
MLIVGERCSIVKMLIVGKRCSIVKMLIVGKEHKTGRRLMAWKYCMAEESWMDGWMDQ